MRIGLVSTIWLNTPPPQYGGTEEVVANLANGLVDKGHQVTLFAPATAHTKATLSPTVSVPLRDKNISWENVAYPLYHITQAFDQIHNFDVLHIHLNKIQDYITLPLALRSSTPVLTTLHFALPTPTGRNDRYQVLEKYKDLPFTAISFAQKKGSNLNVIEVVHNAIDLGRYPFQDHSVISSPNEEAENLTTEMTEEKQDYFLWLGKIKKDKGTKEAILAAKEAEVRLVIAGVVDQGVPESIEYFEKEVKPLIDGKQVEYVGEVGLPYKAELLGGAKALLNPLCWEEPFGLVMIESQATGTPVIAFNRGAASEVVMNGKTGFLVKTVPEMAEKIKEVANLSRADCRQFVEEKFAIDRMVDGYEMAYEATREHWETYLLKAKETIEGYKDKAAEVT